MRLLLVLAGGALGSGARYLIALWMAARFGAVFPWGTLTVNVLGSFLIGLIATFADEHGALSANLRVLLIVGLLGGFTTFSSFSIETLRLIESDTPIRAAVYVAGSLVLTLGAAMIGVAVGRALH